MARMIHTTEDTVAALQAEVVALRAEMQEFAGTVSHDLRAPLRHIVSYAQLVWEDAGPLLDEEAQGFLTTIVDSARHMGALLDGLTELSRVGTVPLEAEAVPLQALVQEVCDSLVSQHPERLVEWHIGQDLPVVHADASIVRQVLLQVLGNAVKFTAGRTPAVIAVQRVADGLGEQVTLEVRDNGAGYNPALQSKLFKVFGRLHSVQQFPGIGMGLALSRKLLQRLGASIAIEGALEAGCTVRIGLQASRCSV